MSEKKRQRMEKKRRGERSSKNPLRALCFVFVSTFVCLGLIGHFANTYAQSMPTTQPTTQPFKTTAASKPAPAFIETFSSPDQREYYSNPPLRVGTIGATTYHRTFCPYAKRALDQYGMAKRVNFWTQQEVKNSKRQPCTYCFPQEFECTEISPADFAQGKAQPFCDTSLHQLLDDPESLDLAGQYLCSLQGYIGVFVGSCDDCLADGSVAGGANVMMASFNAIKNKKGDANKDGDCDDEDFPYFNACYSGDGKPALPGCGCIFDYDNDGDVDEKDFVQFDDSLYSGNSYWACKWTRLCPNAKLNRVVHYPLMVGTEGSNYYHRPNSPVVLSSWERHGIEKRIDFYTWEQIAASKRIPGDAPTKEQWEQEQQFDNCAERHDRCPTSPYDLTGPGGLGEFPRKPLIKSTSAYDLDGDGDVDMEDLQIYQESGQRDPRFSETIELMISTDIPVDKTSRTTLDSVYEGEERVLTAYVEEAPFGWVWRSWERCSSNSRWTHRNSLMHDPGFLLNIWLHLTTMPARLKTGKQ